MKILYTCTYSSGISGVWNRVCNLSQQMLKKGHKVYVFSSNLEAGTLKKAKEHEKIDGIEIFRFPVRSIGSRNAFDFSPSSEKMLKKLKEITPDIVDCQTFRHSEGNIISKECQNLGIPCILTTHAPFDVKSRNFFLSFLALIYDLFASKALKRFKKIIAITKWEYPYLKRLGVKKEKIVYIPNGIAEEFFKPNHDGQKGLILFFGRIAPVKDIETLIKAAKLLRDKGLQLKFRITGPEEKEYRKKLDKFINEFSLDIEFRPPVYKNAQKVKEIDSCRIFVLPSKREAMPQSLLEAMSRSKIAISSKTQGGMELIKDGKTGFLFDIGNEKQLASKIEYCLENWKKLGKVRKNAKILASKFSWKNMSNSVEKLYKQSALK